MPALGVVAGVAEISLPPAESKAYAKWCMGSHLEEDGNWCMAGEGTHILLMSDDEIILYKHSLEIHLCMVSRLILSEVSSGVMQWYYTGLLHFHSSRKLSSQQDTLPNALRFLLQWTTKKMKQNSLSRCCLLTRISQSYLSRVWLEKHKMSSEHSIKGKEQFLVHNSKWGCILWEKYICLSSHVFRRKPSLVLFT